MYINVTKPNYGLVNILNLLELITNYSKYYAISIFSNIYYLIPFKPKLLIIQNILIELNLFPNATYQSL